MQAILFLLFDVSMRLLHPIHVSVSDVEITARDITWTARIYKDDLLLGMYGHDVNMAMLDDQKKVEKDILSFFSRNVQLSIDGKNVKWSLKEIQSDPEAIWIVATADVNSLTSLTVQNRILFDVYSDQKNVVNISWDTGKKNMVFEKGREKKVITL